MYIFKREDIVEDTRFKEFLALHPPIQLLTYTFLNGDTLAQRSHQVSPGIIKRIHIFAADTEAEHEDVGWQIWVGSAIIYPTLHTGMAGTGYEIPIGGAGLVTKYDLNYPILQDDKLTVAINGLGNLTSGVTMVIEYMTFPVGRHLKKEIKQMDKVKKT